MKMKLKAKCTRCQTTFEVEPRTENWSWRSEPVLALDCPGCFRGYVSEDNGKTFESDRPLEILERLHKC